MQLSVGARSSTGDRDMRLETKAKRALSRPERLPIVQGGTEGLHKIPTVLGVPCVKGQVAEDD